MKKNKIFLTALLFSLSGLTQEISVIDVKRNITLSDDDTVYQDFYLNAGDNSALRKNMVINVKRKINVKDASTKSIGDIEVIVGQIKIIQIGNKVSVAREHKLVPRDEFPILDQIGIMTGDRLDMTGAFIDNAKPAAPKVKNTETEVPQKTEETKTADAGPGIPQI